MKIKDVLKFEKENMPDFQWKFEKFLFVFLLIWLGGAILSIILSLIIGFLTQGKGIISYIPIIVWGCALGITLIIFVVKSNKVKSKLYSYHVEILSREFYNIDYSEAKQKMLDTRRITEEGFIVSVEDIFEDTIIRFQQAEIIFNPRFWGGKLFLEIILKDESDWLLIDHLDNAYFNYLINNMHLIQNKNLFQLFCQDKFQFIKILLRYNNAVKIEQKLRTTK